jgi:hypothetical protein
LLCLAASAWVALYAPVPIAPQDQPQPIVQAKPAEPGADRPKESAPASRKPNHLGPMPPASDSTGGVSSIQQAMARVFRLPFSKPTALEDVRAHLQKTLKLPVVLDVAALARQGLKPESTVELELDGVRLKTGLQLLLDQVGLTFRVVPEDELLVLTDREGSDDPLTRIWAEIRQLHRDLHDVQDSVDDLIEFLVPEDAELRMHRPTIIEEMPEARERPAPKDGEEAGPGSSRPSPTGPGEHEPSRRSGGRIKPSPPTQPPSPENSPKRIPLSHPHKRA